MQNSTTPLLEIRQLKITFGSGEHSLTAVNGIDFRIQRGETFVLLGESGCGKSISALSTMRLLPPMANIAQGEILLEGQDLLGLTEKQMRSVRGSRISMIFQEPQTSLNPVLTVGEQIAESLRCHKGLSGKAEKQRVIELLESVGIPEPQRRYAEYPHQFSGGMKQRVMIAIALAGEPDLLIADEPTTALDVTIQAQVLDLLKELQRKMGMAILFITHDLGVASQMADHVAVMYQGEIVEQADRDTFFQSPQHPYSQRLFEMVPSREKRRERDATRAAANQSTQGSGEILLEVTDLKVHFPIRKGVFRRVVGHVPAVDGVSIKVARGRTVAMVGESGSGKTTMGKGILQLIKPTAGNVLFDGDELTSLKAAAMRRRRADIQIVFQDPYSSMNPRMMILDIIEEGMIAQKIGGNRAMRQQRVDELLQQVGLSPEMKLRYPHEFSGGQRQRICIARALAVEPRLIICDEPTSALDVSVQAQILDLLRDLQERLGLSYLLITHNIAVVEYLAHEVAVMYQGRIVEQGSVEQVLESPQHEYTQRLLSAVPMIDKSPRLVS